MWVTRMQIGCKINIGSFSSMSPEIPTSLDETDADSEYELSAPLLFSG